MKGHCNLAIIESADTPGYREAPDDCYRSFACVGTFVYGGWDMEEKKGTTGPGCVNKETKDKGAQILSDCAQAQCKAAFMEVACAGFAGSDCTEETLSQPDMFQGMEYTLHDIAEVLETARNYIDELELKLTQANRVIFEKAETMNINTVLSDETGTGEDTDGPDETWARGEEKERFETGLKELTADFQADGERLLEADPKEFNRGIIERTAFLFQQMLETGVDWNAEQREVMFRVVAKKFKQQDKDLKLANENFTAIGESITNLEQVLFIVTDLVMPRITGKPINREGFAGLLNIANVQDSYTQLEELLRAKGELGPDIEASEEETETPDSEESGQDENGEEVEAGIEGAA